MLFLWHPGNSAQTTQRGIKMLSLFNSNAMVSFAAVIASVIMTTAMISATIA